MVTPYGKEDGEQIFFQQLNSFDPRGTVYIQTFGYEKFLTPEVVERLSGDKNVVVVTSMDAGLQLGVGAIMLSVPQKYYDVHEDKVFDERMLKSFRGMNVYSEQKEVFIAKPLGKDIVFLGDKIGQDALDDYKEIKEHVGKILSHRSQVIICHDTWRYVIDIGMVENGKKI
jgi:hypothetical protein